MFLTTSGAMERCFYMWTSVFCISCSINTHTRTSTQVDYFVVLCCLFITPPLCKGFTLEIVFLSMATLCVFFFVYTNNSVKFNISLTGNVTILHLLITVSLFLFYPPKPESVKGEIFFCFQVNALKITNLLAK